MDYLNLGGKVALVTGAASGIGKATALALFEAGATVVLTDVNEELGREATAEIASSVVFMALDVTEFQSAEAVAAEVKGQFGHLDVLVNAAGWDSVGPFMDNTPEYIERIVQLNLLGPVKVTKALLPALIDSGSGRIVNVASDAGRVGSSGETVYAGAKGGVIAFTKSLAREMTRHQVRVNCVCPGPTDTPLFASLPEKLRAGLERAIPMHRLGQPSEVADAILFFSSDRSSFVTGQVLSVSGGLTMAD